MNARQPSDGITIYDLSPGTRVAERYVIVASHRQGGLSTAFEVTDETSGARLELQLFPATLFERDGESLEFEAFMMPWKNVESDSVIRVQEVVHIDDSTLALVTEYPEGEPLRSRFQSKGPFDAATCISLGCELLSGLTAIHGCSLVHGDIKPSNIWIRGGGDDARATLVDGGITPGLWTAKDLGDKTALIGTPYYAPIEQFGGDSPNVQSDIYNVAVVLFECLTGVLPWPGHSFLEVFQAKLDKRPPSMAKRAPEIEVDPALEKAIVTGCLADRHERYPTAQAFLDALERLA